MKKMRLHPLRIVALFCLFAAMPAWAQGEDSPPDTPDPDDNEDPQLFVDGLISVGLVAGAAYAYRKIQ